MSTRVKHMFGPQHLQTFESTAAVADRHVHMLKTGMSTNSVDTTKVVDKFVYRT